MPCNNVARTTAVQCSCQCAVSSNFKCHVHRQYLQLRASIKYKHTNPVLKLAQGVLLVHFARFPVINLNIFRRIYLGYLLQELFGVHSNHVQIIYIYIYSSQPLTRTTGSWSSGAERVDWTFKHDCLITQLFQTKATDSPGLVET